MLETIGKVFLIIIIPVFLYAISCTLAGTAAKRKCHGCGLKDCNSCDNKKK